MKLGLNKDVTPWEEALDRIDELHGLIDELPEVAEDFAHSVLDSSASMARWIEDNERVTQAQFVTIENWVRGVEAWLK